MSHYKCLNCNFETPYEYAMIDHRNTTDHILIPQEIPPQYKDWNGKVSEKDALDAIIKQLEFFKSKSENIIKLEFEDSMFHMKFEIQLEKQ